MQIGIDLGATKIESVLLDQNEKNFLEKENKHPRVTTKQFQLFSTLLFG